MDESVTTQDYEQSHFEENDHERSLRKRRASDLDDPKLVHGEEQDHVEHEAHLLRINHHFNAHQDHHDPQPHDEGEYEAPYGLLHKTQAILNAFWAEQKESLKNTNFNEKLKIPLARIKRVMKTDDEVKAMLINAEVPILFDKACELFIMEMTLRAFVYSQESKRLTIRASDVTNAVSKVDMYDFLIDIIPREEPNQEGNEDAQQPQPRQRDATIFPFMPNPLEYMHLLQRMEEGVEGEEEQRQRGDHDQLDYQEGNHMDGYQDHLHQDGETQDGQHDDVENNAQNEDYDHQTHQERVDTTPEDA